MKIFPWLFTLAFSLNASADDWTTIASCVTPDGMTGGGALYHDGTDLVLQMSTLTTALEEYRSDRGNIPAIVVDQPNYRADLELGVEKTVALTKPTSTEVEGTVSDAALFTLQLPADTQKTATAVNAKFSRRGLIMLLVCNRVH